MALFKAALVAFEIEHENCWSKLTMNHPVMMRTLFAKPSRERDHILGMDEIKVLKVKDFRSFLRSFKKEKSILEVLYISEIDKRRGIYRILFKEKYDNMIMGILNNYTVFYLKDIIKDGVERLLVIIPVEEVNSLKQDLQVLGEIRYFKARHIELDSFISTFFDLSDQERNAVIEAVKRGYYDYPRRINLENLGNVMDLSKPTLEEYIRKAEKKIMRKVYNEILQYNILLDIENAF